MSADAAAQNKYKQIFSELLKIPENKRCAECGDTYPNWASANLGIFLCVTCASVHRGLGTHISFVRSVSLDQWKEEQIRTMIRWGNKRACEYWEERLKVGERPPVINHKFLTEKYEHKCYAARAEPTYKNVPVDLSQPIQEILKIAKGLMPASPPLLQQIQGSLFPLPSATQAISKVPLKKEEEEDFLKFF